MIGVVVVGQLCTRRMQELLTSIIGDLGIGADWGQTEAKVTSAGAINVHHERAMTTMVVAYCLGRVRQNVRVNLALLAQKSLQVYESYSVLIRERRNCDTVLMSIFFRRLFGENRHVWQSLLIRHCVT